GRDRRVNGIEPPSIEYARLMPMLLVFGAAVVGVLVEALAPQYLRKAVHMPLTLLSLLGAIVLIVVQATGEGVPTSASAMGAIAVDGPAMFIWAAILLLSF